MAFPTPSTSATVSVGSEVPNQAYLASLRENSCYSFYRGSNRYMALFRYPHRPDADGAEILSMWKSGDDGATWGILDDANAPVVSEGYPLPGGAYDVRIGAGLNLETASLITVMFDAPETDLLVRHLRFADFSLESDTWSAPYGGTDAPLGVTNFEFSSAPNGAYAYSLQNTGVWTLHGVPDVGPSPRLIVQSNSDGNRGNPTGFGNVGNVRIVGPEIVFPQIAPGSGSLEVVRGNVDLSADAGGGVGVRVWVAETVTADTGIFALRDNTLWLIAGKQLYWVGQDDESIYRSTKSGGTWGAPELVWSCGTDSNPDLEDHGIASQLCVSANPVLGSGDLSWQFDGLTSGARIGMLTCHIEDVPPEPQGGPKNRYYGW